METQTYIKNVKISPKKLRFILPEIKKLSPAEALDRLFYMPKKSARIFYKAIKSAVDNAKLILKTSEKQLKFRLLTVEQGRKLKRFRAGGRGAAKSIMKRHAHIKIILAASKSINSKRERPIKSQTQRSKQKTKKV